MVDIQSAEAEVRRVKKRKVEIRTNDRMKIYMVCPITQGDHKDAHDNTVCISPSTFCSTVNN